MVDTPLLDTILLLTLGVAILTIKAPKIHHWVKKTRIHMEESKNIKR